MSVDKIRCFCPSQSLPLSSPLLPSRNSPRPWHLALCFFDALSLLSPCTPCPWFSCNRVSRSCVAFFSSLVSLVRCLHFCSSSSLCFVSFPLFPPSSLLFAHDLSPVPRSLLCCPRRFTLFLLFLAHLPLPPCLIASKIHLRSLCSDMSFPCYRSSGLQLSWACGLASCRTSGTATNLSSSNSGTSMIAARP